MQNSFKQSMRWLHTYSGLVLGWLLFAIFVTGTSSYYRSEISLWMQPELHYSTQSSNTINIATQKAVELTKKTSSFNVILPDDRRNTIIATYREKSKKSKRAKRVTTYYDASTGEELNSRKTYGGSFLYRFHYELYGIPHNISRWGVGIATMFMFVAIITGILIHTRIFKDVFVFRPNKNIRSWMDVHILPAVAALPFMIMITYSGLLLFMNLMMPWGIEKVYADKPREYRKDISVLSEPVKSQRQKVNRVALENKKAHISKENLEIILNKANEVWPNNIAGFSISKSKNAYISVQIRPKNSSTIYNSKSQREYLLFDGGSTNLIKKNIPLTSENIIVNTNLTFSSLHRARFADSTMRALFFVSGLCGVLIIASGLILWVVKRKKKYEKKKSYGFVLVEKLNLGTIVGIFLAIAIYFLANRFIAVEENARHIWEINAFFIAWLFAFIYAFIRNTKKAWIELSSLVAFLFLLIPLLEVFVFANSVSEYFMKDSILFYIDLFFLFTSSFFAMCSYVLFRRLKKGDK